MTTAFSHTAVILQGGPCWIGWAEEILGVKAQEQRREALELNRQDALAAAGLGAACLPLKDSIGNIPYVLAAGHARLSASIFS